MREFNYNYTRPGDPNTHTGYGKCFEISKASNFFSYTFHDYQVCKIEGLTTEQVIQFTESLVEEFIKEFSLSVNFVRHNYTFSFSGQPLEIYACIIISRWMVFDDINYILLLRNIYSLRDRGYTMFERYIISSSASENANYSFSSKGLVFLENYRRIKNKKSIIGTSTLNYTYINLLCQTSSLLVRNSNEDIEDYYKRECAFIEPSSKKFLKINLSGVQEYLKSIQKDSSRFHYTNNRTHVPRLVTSYLEDNVSHDSRSQRLVNARIQRYSPNEIIVTTMGVVIDDKLFESVKLVDASEYLLDNKDKIKFNEDGSLEDNKFNKRLQEIFDGKLLNLSEEIKILNEK